MITYKHIKSGLEVTRDTNSGRFTALGGNILIPTSVVENSKEWKRMLKPVVSYPAELVEPLFNCRLENYEKHVEKLEEYKKKIQES